MDTAAPPTCHNRTITVAFQDEATYFRLLNDGKAFVEVVLAFVLSLGFQLKHKASCRGDGCLTRHSPSVRVRLGGITIWRVPCTACKAVVTVLPPFVLRYRAMRPEVARDALLAVRSVQDNLGTETKVLRSFMGTDERAKFLVLICRKYNLRGFSPRHIELLSAQDVKMREDPRLSRAGPACKRNLFLPRCSSGLPCHTENTPCMHIHDMPTFP